MLFALEEHNPGEHSCYFCGASCDETYSTDTYVKDTFTNRDIVKSPNSLFICRGCIMAMGNGWGDMPMIDGSVKKFTTPRGMAQRMYSWLLYGATDIQAAGRLAFTKAHLSTVRDLMVEYPLEPPFAWILSDSGQKNLIFRSPVSWSREHFTVLLEDREISVDREVLRQRLALASSISTKIGKPVLTETPAMYTYIAARKAGVEEQLQEWQGLVFEPISILAAWMAPAKIKE